MKIPHWFVMILAVLLFLPSAAQADKRGKSSLSKQPVGMDAQIDYRLEKDRRGFNVYFSNDVVSDKNLLYKELEQEERPFRLSPPVESKSFWKDARTLRIDLLVTDTEFERLLERGPLEIRWNKDFKSLRGRVLAGTHPGAGFISTYMSLESKVDKSGRLISSVKGREFTVAIDTSAGSQSVNLRLHFNRFMVPREKWNKRMTIEEAPFTLTPELPLTGRWIDERTLVYEASFSRQDFWEKVSDLPFTLKWKKDFETMDGESVTKAAITNFDAKARDLAKPFYFSRFAVSGLAQAGLDLEGQVELDLIFNKPVRAEDLKGRLKGEIWQASTWNAKTRQDEEIYGPLEVELLGVGRPTDPDNTLARLRLKAKPDQLVRVTVDGVRSADGRGRLAEKASLGLTVNDYFAVRRADLRIEESYPWKPYFSIEIQEPLIFEGIEKFIKLEPALPFTVSPYGQNGNSIQIFAPFDAETPVKITLLPGLKSQRGILLNEIVYDAKISPKSDRRLIFTGRGRYLSPEKPLLVKIAGRNADKVRLQGWRVYENNLATIINTQEYDASLRTRLAVQFSDNLLDKNTRTGAKMGETFERLLDLKQLLSDSPKGAYLLKISRVEDDDEEDDEDDYYYYSRYDYYDYYYHPERYLPVMISDLGLSARVLPEQSSVMVASLSQAAPVTGATVKFYDRANQVIAQGSTDSDGLCRMDIAAGRSAFLTVEKDGDLNYLNLASSSRSSYGYDDYDDYEYYANQWREDSDSKWFGGEGGWLAVDAPTSQGPMRDYLTRGYEAFLFMPRDIFKPGETVSVKAMVRDRDIAPPANPFPVVWRLTDPDGRTLGQGRAEMNKNGGLDFQAEIPFSARTGSWEAAIYLPEASSPLGRVKFTVEDFVPPRLAIELAALNKVYAESNPEIGVTADVKYLFGAPGVGLKWELDAVISPSAWRPEGWSGFDFAGPPSDFQTTRQKRVKRGELDEEGHAEITFKPDLEEKRLPNRMNVEMVVSVQEDGGRWNAKKINVDYFPRPLILGSKAPESAAPGRSFDFEVAALTPEAKPADVAQLAVEVFQVNTRYYNSYRYGRNYRQSMEELSSKAEKVVNLKEGRGKFAFVPEAAGVYEVKITDPDSDLTVRRRVWVYGLETAQEKTAKDLVQISFDKENYRPGDTARVKIKSPFPGRLWLTVDTDRPVFAKSLDLRGTETVMEIPVTADIKTNAQVAVGVVRPLAEGQTGYRALGAASLEINREIYRLKVEADMPEHVKPSSQTKLIIKLSDDQGRPMAGEATVSLVDEGVLSLTNFKTPDPWRLFTTGRHLLTRFYDLYELLLPVEKAAVPFLTPGGGDGIGRSGLFSPFKRNQEILSIFVATVTVDESGQAEVELNLPEYSGQGRLMVVAASGSRFGTARRDIKISRDLTAEVTLPLALAPGDRFEIPVRAFLSAEAKAEAGQGAVLKFRTEGPIRLLETAAEASFNLAPGGGETRLLKAVAEPSESGGDQAGLGRLIVESKSGLGEVFSQTLETAVRPPYPRVSLTESQGTKKAETTIVVPTQGYLKGTVESSLTVARHPAIEAARAIRYLSSYPYGCLEQTTSRAWTFVAAGDILTGLEAGDNQAHHIKQGLEAAVQRLATMQTAQGGFAYWPGESYVYEWGSVYAIHFLTEAGRKIELPKGLMERSLSWLNSYLGADYNGSSNDMSYILSTRAYAAFVLALNGRYPVGWVNALKDRYEGLSPSGRIFLAGAEAIRDGNPKALKALDAKDFDLSLDTRAWRISSLESRPRNLALKLLAWVEVDPLSEKARDLALAVVEEGRKGRWRNTQENGLAVLALGNYLAKSAVGRPYTATVLDADGRTLLTAGPALAASLGPKAMAAVQDKPLTLKIEGEGRPYWNLTVAAVPTEAPAPKAEGLALTRSWILSEGAEHSLSTPEETAEDIHVTKGDRVTVVLTVKAKEALQNMVLVDLVPGGFEIENPRLIPEAETGESDDGDDDDDGPVYGSRLEIREDRLVIIEPWLGDSGETVYRYTMRAVTAGEYVIPPTVVEGMYEPDKQAVIAGGKVIVGN